MDCLPSLLVFCLATFCHPPQISPPFSASYHTQSPPSLLPQLFLPRHRVTSSCQFFCWLQLCDCSQSPALSVSSLNQAVGHEEDRTFSGQCWPQGWPPTTPFLPGEPALLKDTPGPLCRCARRALRDKSPGPPMFSLLGPPSCSISRSNRNRLAIRVSDSPPTEPHVLAQTRGHLPWSHRATLTEEAK